MFRQSVLFSRISSNLCSKFEMLRQLSSNPSNTVVGLVRDKVSTEKEVSQELPGRKNIHIVHGDITNYASLQKAVQETAAITGGSLDYVIANAASLAKWSAYKPIGALYVPLSLSHSQIYRSPNILKNSGAEPQKLEEHIHEVLQTNLIGDIHLFNLTIPLIQAGRIKKIIAISSGHADADIAAKYEVSDNAIYAISKAALNMAIAKFSAQYAKEGILFLGVSPGVVDTGNNADGESVPIWCGVGEGGK
jgi:NAD(P)-dependent dehydrogenase (short-subunit alcohol dehydrogenase family)